MHKPGSKGGFRLVGGNKWNRRYVWIQANAVHYGQEPKKSERSVPLKELRSVRACAKNEVMDEKGPQQYSANGWKLTTQDKSIIFVTENQADRDSWVLALSKHIKRLQHPELDDEDELAYSESRRLSEPPLDRQSSMGQSFAGAGGRSMSVMSTQHFNSDEIDELMEGEEIEREGLEKHMMKGFRDLSQKYFDEMETAIAAESRAASEARQRAASLSLERARSMSMLTPRRDASQPASPEGKKSNDDEATRAAAAQQALLQAQRQSLSDTEQNQREVLVGAEHATLREMDESFVSRLKELSSAEAARREAARKEWERRRQQEGADLMQAEASARRQLEQAEGKEANRLQVDKDKDMKRSRDEQSSREESERKSRDAARRAQLDSFASGESEQRRTVIKDHTDGVAQLHVLFTTELRAVEAKLLQDEALRIAFAQRNQREDLVGVEESARSDVVISEENERAANFGSRWEREKQAAERAAKERIEEAVKAIRRRHEAEQVELLDAELSRRGAVVDAYDESSLSLMDRFHHEASKAHEAALQRIEAAAAALREAHVAQQQALIRSEADARKGWLQEYAKAVQHNVTLGKDGRTSAEAKFKARAAREESARAAQRAALEKSESDQRLANVATSEQSERTSLATVAKEHLAKARKKQERRETLQKQLGNDEAEQRFAIMSKQEVPARTFLSQFWQVSSESLFGALRCIDDECTERVQLSIFNDMELREAIALTECRLRVEACVADEASLRSDTCSSREQELSELKSSECEHREQRVKYIAQKIEEQRCVMSACDAAKEETMFEAHRSWESIGMLFTEGRSAAELLTAQRLNNIAAILAKELEVQRNHFSRGEVETRMEIEEEEETEWAPIPQVAAKRWKVILEADAARRKALDEGKAKQDVQERTTLVSQEHDSRGRDVLVPEEHERLALHTEYLAATQRLMAKATQDATPATDTAVPSTSSPASSSRSRGMTVSQRDAKAAEKKRIEEAIAAQEALWKEEQAIVTKFVHNGSWVYKPGSQATKSSVFRIGGSKWNKRYLWVSGNDLVYGEKPRKAEKSVPLKSIRKVEAIRALEADREGSPKDLREYVWKLSATDKSILFACTSDKDRSSWIRFLEVISGQSDLESVTTSIRSFAAASGIYGTNSVNDDDNNDDQFSEGEDPFADDDDDMEDADDKNTAAKEPTRTSSAAAAENQSLTFISSDSSRVLQEKRRSGLEPASFTLEQWIQILQEEETDQRDAMESAEKRYRTKIIDSAREEMQQRIEKEATAAQGSFVVGRPRGDTKARSQESVRRAEEAAARAAAEVKERSAIVQKGAWMYKPRSKSTTSSAFMRSLSSIGGSTWNKRYVWVKDEKICYGERPGKVEKEVALKAIQSVYAVPPATMQSEGAPQAYWTLGFKLTADDRSIMWAAPDAKTRKAFIDYLTPLAKRQPSGLQPRNNAYDVRHSLNNDTDGVDDDELENPFGDDDDENSPYDITKGPSDRSGEEQKRTASLEEVSGGPTTRSKRNRRQSTVSLAIKREPEIPLTNLPMFLQNTEQLTQLRKEEGLVGVGVASGDGLCLRSVGEVDGMLCGRTARLMCLSESLHGGPLAVVGKRRGSSASPHDDQRPTPRHHAREPSPGGSTRGIVASAQRKAPLRIEVEIDSASGQHAKVVSCGSVTGHLDLLFTTVHQLR